MAVEKKEYKCKLILTVINKRTEVKEEDSVIACLDYEQMINGLPCVESKTLKVYGRLHVEGDYYGSDQSKNQS